jgi:diguanylate cyclase (GGDEF)-like protein
LFWPHCQYRILVDMGMLMKIKASREKTERELGSFDINIINIMTYLYRSNAVEDEVMETLRMLNYEYHSLLDKNRILEQKVNIDAKTNLLKYRDDYLTMIIKSASRILDIVRSEQYIITYIRFDIDNFSKLNNRFGHDKGDIVLVDLANILKENSRPTDYLIRFGGEEFDVILPATDLEGATTYLKKIYKRLRGMKYVFEDTEIKVTVSAGIARLSIELKKLRRINDGFMKREYLKLQKAADDALYDAKLSGKNQYKIYDKKIDYNEIRRRYLDTG